MDKSLPLPVAVARRHGPRDHGRHDRGGAPEPRQGTGTQAAFKNGWRPTFHTLPVRDGHGYSAVFGVPLGVTAEMTADQRPVLARNVYRAEVEVWPSDTEKAGTGPGRIPAAEQARPGAPPDARRHGRRVRGVACWRVAAR